MQAKQLRLLSQHSLRPRGLRLAAPPHARGQGEGVAAERSSRQQVRTQKPMLAKQMTVPGFSFSLRVLSPA